MLEEILFFEEKQLGFITLNRPQALNALSFNMIKALAQQLALWQDDPAIHAVIVQAAGDKAFCAGGDVRWLYAAGLRHDPQQLEFFEHEYRLNQLIHQFNKPYIALLQGITMGGGVGISLHGSFPLASEQFVFAMPETAIGFFPDIGASYLLSRCPDYFGIYLALTGSRLNAPEALLLGLVKQVIARENMPDLVTRLKQSDLSKEVLLVIARCIQDMSMPVQASSDFDEIRAFVKACFAFDSVEDIFSALAAREDAWSKRVLSELKQKSPLSLKITLAQLQKAKTLSMAECIKLDYCLVKKFIEDHDFYEGVRALLIDKDNQPHWQPKSLAEVDDKQVARYFSDR